MKSKNLLWLIIILVCLAILFDMPNISKKIPRTKYNLSYLSDKYPIKLGLDLQGGSELVLQTQMGKIPEDQKDSALDSAKNVIERRVNAFGVSESVVQSSKVGKDRRILVDLPGVKDSSAAGELVGKTAQLDFREEPDNLKEATKSGIPLIFLYKKTNLTGADLKSAQVSFNQTNEANSGSPQVSIEFNSDGAKKFDAITKRNIGKPLAIFLDDQPVEAPVVQQEIIGGSAVISGHFTPETAKTLAIQLNAGALPVPIKILSQNLIAPSLGQISVEESLVAGIIGLTIVIVYMALYYGSFGLIADLALIIYALFVLVIFKTGLFILPPVTLTLSGITGFILSIGMAVDANILIFERMKEEIRWGKSSRTALELGFNRAWSSIRDSNISSLITAAILYSFGTGLVKGFAITLAIGVLVSMFTAVVVTRTFLRLFVK